MLAHTIEQIRWHTDVMDGRQLYFKPQVSMGRMTPNIWTHSSRPILWHTSKPNNHYKWPYKWMNRKWNVGKPNGIPLAPNSLVPTHFFLFDRNSRIESKKKKKHFQHRSSRIKMAENIYLYERMRSEWQTQWFLIDLSVGVSVGFSCAQ